MKFSSYGYKEKKIEVREMSMGAVVLTACQALVKKDKADIQIWLVDTYMGEVSKWDGVKGILTHDWPADYRVNFLEACIMHNNIENFDYLKIVIRDDVDEDE